MKNFIVIVAGGYKSFGPACYQFHSIVMQKGCKSLVLSTRLMLTFDNAAFIALNTQFFKTFQSSGN